MSPRPSRPVSRPRVLAGALVLAGLLALVISLAEALRPSPVIEPVDRPVETADVRDSVECPPPPDGTTAGDPPTVSSNELYECPRSYDGREVRFEGEVVGALLARSSGVWAQLNDDVYAGDLGPLPAHREFRGGNAGVGVRIPQALADTLGPVGGPRARGDVLEVTGVFHRVHPESGEVAVITARQGSIVRTGGPIEHDHLPVRRVVAQVLASLTLLVLGAGRAVRRRQERPSRATTS